ncbi:hypothetical protein L7F22_015707 [Adiantum nelumboides]|nr:hypothetical protein [Adiantum nelumboides]
MTALTSGEELGMRSIERVHLVDDGVGMRRLQVLQALFVATVSSIQLLFNVEETRIGTAAPLGLRGLEVAHHLLYLFKVRLDLGGRGVHAL